MRISDWSSDVCSSDLSVSLSLELTLRNDAVWFVPSSLVEERVARNMLVRLPMPFGGTDEHIGGESCRDRVCQYVSISVVAVALKKNTEYSIEYNMKEDEIL